MQQWRALKLRVQDFKDLWLQTLHNLGKSARRPQFGHFTYWEKIEYWALVWGTVIMALTGLLLWFENLSLQIFPLWILDVATAIHFYEDVLATLAIFKANGRKASRTALQRKTLEREEFFI